MLNSSNTNAANNHCSYLTDHILPSIIGSSCCTRAQLLQHRAAVACSIRIYIGQDTTIAVSRNGTLLLLYADCRPNYCYITTLPLDFWGSILHRMLPQLWSRGSNWCRRPCLLCSCLPLKSHIVRVFALPS